LAKKAGSAGNDGGQAISTDLSGNVFVTEYYGSPTFSLPMLDYLLSLI